MKLVAAVANSLWLASSFGAWRTFRSALQRPAQVQQEWLRQHLARNTSSEFADRYKLAAVRDYEQFAARVPVQTYESLEPWIQRIHHGKLNLLTSERVTHLIPTSGSTGERKLIPFTAGLQRDFDHAIAPWVFDLAQQHPGILGGPAYWSISPALPTPTEPSAVPVGFGDDASYLGGAKRWLVRAALITPQEPLCAVDLNRFQQATLLALLNERELRLLSVWHPSFLLLLLDALPDHWDKLVATIAHRNPSRARELNRAEPLRPETLWPNLRVISCWGDAQAECGCAELHRRFPSMHVQRKGLLATEAMVTIPFAGEHPLAVRSHFFEFADDAGRIRQAHELAVGMECEVIVTTSGGLWRYRLGDRVRVSGFVQATPTLQFLGRTGNITDLRGEKLSEAFVGSAIQRVSATLGQPRFAMLAPETTNASPHYTLFLNSQAAIDDWQVQLEAELRRNPNYDYCRQLNQLVELSVAAVGPDAGECFLEHEARTGRRFGEIKLSYLSQRAGWRHILGATTPTGWDQRPSQPPSMFSTAPLR